MWKETIISTVIIVIIVIGNVVTQNYTVDAIEELSKDLSELKAEIERYNENIGEENIKNKMNKIEENWHKRHEKLAYYIEHDELEKVETNIVALKSFIESNEYSEAVSELDKSVFILKHI